MLSRIADALFWIGRYMERAEDTARILDVTYHMMLEGTQEPARVRWDGLIDVAGAREPFSAAHPETTAAAVAEFLCFRTDNPNSIVGCVGRARENARAIRDRLSREMWEDLNSLYLEVGRFPQGEVAGSGPHRFCDLVKFGSHGFHGVAAATLPRDEGWWFLQAGQALERATMTARIVDVQYHRLVEGGLSHGDADDHQWMAVLRSVAAYEFYRRQYHARIAPEKVAALLVLHPHHPRAIRFNVATLEAALRAISGSSPDTYANEAERLVGRLHEVLKYDRIEDVFARGLHQALGDVQRACTVIGDEIARSYFHYAVAS